ncbi:hypothetical protein KPH14_008075 [Odynerus spinipes]|uniref:Uncharacterized protein n=1 Tax=Odynerus spinipes TaxID=1348599 RepID=A0AAD9RK92_9HYME|nr:hypothetical protein KPH14_008075 [Odynerus spinipes]
MSKFGLMKFNGDKIVERFTEIKRLPDPRNLIPGHFKSIGHSWFLQLAHVCKHRSRPLGLLMATRSHLSELTGLKPFSLYSRAHCSTLLLRGGALLARKIVEVSEKDRKRAGERREGEESRITMEPSEDAGEREVEGIVRAPWWTYAERWARSKGRTLVPPWW